MTYLLEAITPTRIYHKQCQNCGLNYLGKTTSEYVEKYEGSGKHWQRHLKKHNVKPIHIWNSDWFYDTSIGEYALCLSEKLNIVESKEWANIKPENGLDGGWDGWNGSEKHREASKKGGKTSGMKMAENFRNGVINDGQLWFTKEKIKERGRLGRKAFEEKYPYGFAWKQSQSTLENQKKAFKEIKHQQGVKNSQYGTMWITNGFNNAKITKDQEIPEGYRKGRVMIKKKP
jgi:hypothetical protein